ncbi:MAG: glucose-1-phosphate cytidylyltransferase [Candidatus Kentron sp. G]|nr:MAG: glucose-1-phosphate cytidylyltransferase [Candidatus Kentron sp. G]VFM97006.1 MAG: glucose-1-phosphate cytidylyltransferase [Candidatus Kentron sp. G]
MKAVILAGGLGTRLAEETEIRPKPMVEIGERPILWHIMKLYANHGINEFIVCLGYKGYMIKEFFFNYIPHHSDITIDLASGRTRVHNNRSESWTVTLVDTGIDSGTGGRLRRVREHVGEDIFLMTYGDGLSSIDITASIIFHKQHGLLATVGAVRPPGRFGVLQVDGQARVTGFQEKPEGDSSWINGGFFVLSPRVIDYIDDDKTSWEEESMVRLARDGQLAAYHHDGFWRPMDTLRDKNYLQNLWDKGAPPWKKWS